MGNNASSLPEALASLSTTELKKSRSADKSWLHLPATVSDFTSHDSSTVSDFPEACELDSDPHSKITTADSAGLHSEIGYVIPLPHSETEKQLEETVAKLSAMVQTRVLATDCNSNTIAKVLNSLIKAHGSLQRVRALEAKSTSEAASDPLPSLPRLSLSSVPLLWILSNPTLLEGPAGKSLFDMVNLVCAGTDIGALTRSEFREAKDTLLTVVKGVADVKGSGLATMLGLALGFADLRSVLEVVERLLEKDVPDEDVLSLKPQLLPLLTYESNPNPDSLSAFFGPGNSSVVISPSRKTVTYDGSHGYHTSYLDQTFSQGSIYVEFLMEQSSAAVEVADSAFLSSSGNDTSNARIRYCEGGSLEYPGNNESYPSFESKDVIGVHLNFVEKTVSFYKNGTKAGSKTLLFGEVRVGVFLQRTSSITILEKGTVPKEVFATLLRPVAPAASPVAISSDQSNLSLRAALAIVHSLGNIAAHFASLLSSVVDVPSYIRCYGLAIDIRKEVFEGVYGILKRLKDRHATVDDSLRPQVAEALLSTLSLLDLQLNVASKMHLTASLAPDKQLVDTCYQLMTTELVTLTPALKEAVSKTVGSALDMFLSKEESRLAYILEQLTKGEGDQAFEHLANATLIDPMLQKIDVEALKPLQKALVRRTLSGNEQGLNKFFWAYVTLLFSNYSFTDKDRLLPLCLHLLSELSSTVRSSILSNDLVNLLHNAEQLNLLFLAVSLSKFSIETLVPVLQPLLEMLDAVCSAKRPRDDRLVVTSQKTVSFSESKELAYTRAAFVFSLTGKEALPSDTKVELVTAKETLAKGLEELADGWWTKMVNGATVKVTITGQTSGTVEMAVTEETVYPKFYKTNLKLIRESITFAILKIATALVSGSYKQSENKDEEVQKALNNPIVSAGIRDNAWIFLKETVELPGYLEELSGPLLIEEELDAEPEVPNLGRSFSMMTEKESSSSLPAQPTTKGDLSAYFTFLRKATQLPFLVEQSVFLESLIEGKGSPGQLWTHVHKLLGLDKKPYSRMGGSVCDKAERMVLAVLIKFADLRKDVEKLTLEVTDVPANVADLWRKANVIRSHLVQKQQTENIEEAATRTIQLGILLLNSDFKASLSALGFSTKPLSSKRRKSEDMPTLSKALSLTPESSKETTQALVMLKRLKQGYHHDVPSSEPGSLPELILTFVKSSVSVEDLGKEIKARRENAISRVVGLGMMHLLQKKPKIGSMVAKSFSGVMQKRHFLEGLGGIDPSLQECLRTYFFKLYNTCCESFLSLISPSPILSKPSTSLTLSHLLSAVAFPFKPSDFASLTNLRLQQTLTQLLRCAKFGVKVANQRFAREKVVTKVVKADGEPGFTLVRKESSQKWVSDIGFFADKAGWAKVDHNFGTEDAPKYLFYRRSREDRYLVDLELDSSGELKATFKNYKDLKEEAGLAELPSSIREICWAVIKLFIYTLVQAKGAEATSASAVKFTEVFLHAIYEELDVQYGSADAANLFALIKGEKWGETKATPSQGELLLSDFEKLTRGNAPEVNEMILKYESWDTGKTYRAISLAAIKQVDAEAPEILPEWLDSDGKFDLIVYLRALRAGHGADRLKEDSRKFVEESKPLENLKGTMSDLDTKPGKPTESEPFIHSLLWLLLVSSHSETALKILRGTDYLKLLLTLAFSKDHASFNTLSFRILERIVPTIDRLETLDSALSSEVKASIGGWMETDFTTKSFLYVITALASVLVTRNVQWSVKPKSNVNDVALIGDCCRGMLVNALKVTAWRAAFVKMVEECTEKLRHASEDVTNTSLVDDYPSLLGSYHILTGALSLSEPLESECFTLLKQIRIPSQAGTSLIIQCEDTQAFNYDTKETSGVDATATSSGELLAVSPWEEPHYATFLKQLFTLVAVRKELSKRVVENTRVVNTHRAFWGFITNSVYFYLREPGQSSSEAAQLAISIILDDLKKVSHSEPALKKMREALLKLVRGKDKPVAAAPEKVREARRSRRRRSGDSSESDHSIQLGGLFGDNEDDDEQPEEQKQTASDLPAESAEETKGEEKKEEEKAETINCLYRITKLQMSPFAQVSCFKESDFHENEFGNPTILSKKPARMDLNFGHEVFRNVSSVETFNGVTVQVALGPADGLVTGTFGFRLGDLTVEVSVVSADLLTAIVSTPTEQKLISSSIPNASTLCFRIHLFLNGLIDVKLFGADSNASLGPMTNPAFTGYSMAGFSFYTESQETLTLRGLQIFEGLIRTENKFWNESAIDASSKPLSSRVASVNIRTDTTDLSEVLSITGAGPTLESQAISHSPSLLSSLSYLLYDTDQTHWESSGHIGYLDYPIVDIRLFYRRADVPKTYEVAKYWIDGKLVSECTEANSPGRKIIAYLKRPLASVDSYIEGITMIPKTQEMNNYTYIGNLTIAEGETHEPELGSVPQNGQQSLIYITRKTVSKLPSNFLTEIAILESSSSTHVNTPRGYIPVPFFTKDNDSAKANISVLNLDLTAGTTKLVTLAISTSTNILGFPVRSLATKSGGKDVKFTGGMVDSYDSAPADEPETDIKDFENDLKNWSQFELECGLKEVEEQLSYYKGVSAIEQLANKHPSAFAAAINDRKTFSTFLGIAVSKAKNLPEVIGKVLSSDSAEVDSMRKLIVMEITAQLYMQATQEKVVNLMPTRLIESIHPYENNMNVQDVISIPGATSLLIEFDPQTKTESGCDPLRFYRRAGNIDEICVYSGDVANFKPLEIDGDTVYMKFTSDGSVVYWGYKFTVTPKSKSKPKTAVRAPEYQTMNINTALWLLENYKGWNLGRDLGKLTSTAILNAAGIAMHNLNGDQQTKMISVFQGLMQGSVVQDFPVTKGKTVEENLDMFIETLERGGAGEYKNQWKNALEREAKDLFVVEQGESDVSPKMKALAGLLANTSRDQHWLNYSKTVFGLEGISSSGARYYALLLSYAQESGLISLNHTEEIEPHYNRAEVVKKVYIPGASVVNVVVDEKIGIEAHHSMVISTKEDLSEIVYSTSEKMVETSATFSGTNKGANFVVTHEGHSVEYQNSSWQTIIIDKELRADQRFVIEYHIDECSDTDNVGFGLHEIQPAYTCNNCGLPGNGFASRSWCLRGNGEFYSPGAANINERMSQGCKVTIEGDLRTKVFNWLLNGKRVGSVTLDTSRVMLNFTTYNNCKVTIAKFVESVVLGTELSGREYIVPSGTFYYAFPVNRAFEDWQSMALRAPFDKLNISMQFSAPDFSGVFQRVLLDPKIQHGRSYREVQIIDVLDSILEVGVAEGGEAMDMTMVAGGSYALASNGEVNFAGLKSEAKKGFKNGDLVSFLADAEARKITFAVNGEEVASGEFNLTGKLYPGVCCHSTGQKLLFIKSVPDVSLLRLDETGKSKKGGLKMVVKPVISGVEGLVLAKSLTPADRATFLAFLSMHTKFTKFADSDLCAYVDSIAKKQSLKCSEMKPATLTCEKDDMLVYPMLEPFTADEIRSRFSLILHINSLFSSSFKLVDLSLPSDLSKASRMQKVIVNCREYLFYDLKHEMLQGIMRTTHSDSRQDICINRMRANTLMLKGVKDLQNSVSVFAQAMKIIHPWPHRNLRNSERIFTVNLTNESAGDAGGPYNEVITTISEEAMSDFITLFVKTPNNVQNIGTNRDTYTINPDATTQTHMDMYLFMGKLFGVAIRTQNNMHLFLPPLFWKKLMLAPVTLSDLKGIDESVFQAIELLRNPAGKNVDAEQFKSILEDFTFTTKNSAGTSIDLKPGGASVPVTVETVAEYADLIEKCRLTENDRAYLEIRKGMSAVIPLDILNLLSWSQVESLVCGAPTWDVERVKSNTHYEGYSATDRVVEDFWAVVGEFTVEQKVLFLRFSWGRSRLPAAGSFKNFQLTKMGKEDPDHALPAAHTCFFTIDLPEYTNRNVLRERLVFAVTHCQAYDIDHLPDEIDEGGQGGAAEEEEE